MEISKEGMNRMLHAIGYDNTGDRSPWVYEAYRNYSIYGERVNEWETLVANGYAERNEQPHKKEVVYRVTKKGFQAIANHTKKNIRIELEFEPEQ